MDYFSYKDDELYAENVAIKELASKVGTPFYVYSKATIERHYNVFADGIDLDNIKICFAVKSNSNLAVLSTLAKIGAGADVVSGGEIRLALKAGISPKNIVFSGVGKTKDELEYALNEDIFQFNVESYPELEALNEIAIKLGKIANIAIRVNPDVDAKTHAKISTGKSENKFGIPIHQAKAIYAEAAKLNGIAVQGISVHIGSQLTDLDPFYQAFSRVKEFVSELKNEGHNISVIDLGGGLGIPYDDSAPPLPIEYGKIVRELFADYDGTLVFEPGRLISGNAGILVSEVIYVKKGDGKSFIIADAAMNDLMRPSLYEAYHQIIPVLRYDNRKDVVVDIVGPVCETGDTFAVDREIQELKTGELLAFRSAGAYGAVMGSTYNARPLAPEIMVNGDEWHIIRSRLSYEEIMEQQSIPSW